MRSVQHASKSRNSDSFFTELSTDHWTSGRNSKILPVVFHNKQYPSATAALEAYISDFEGRPFSFQSKYETEWWELFSPVILKSPHASPQRPTPENAEVISALNATSELLKYIDDDKLPSVTDVAHRRGFVTNRASATTVATEVLLKANPYGLQSAESLSTLETNDLLSADPLSNLRRSQSKQTGEYLKNSSSKLGSKAVYDYVIEQKERKSKAVNNDSRAGMSESSIGFGSSEYLVDDQSHDHQDRISVRPPLEPLTGYVATSTSSDAGLGNRLPPKWVNELEGSEGSSIVTGHFQGRPVSNRTQAKKMASTPKHTNKKGDILSSPWHETLENEPPPKTEPGFLGHKGMGAKPKLKEHPRRAGTTHRPLPYKPSIKDGLSMVSAETDDLIFHSAFPGFDTSLAVSASQGNQDQNSKHKQYLDDLMTEIEHADQRHHIDKQEEAHSLLRYTSEYKDHLRTLGLQQLLQKYKSVQKMMTAESETGTSSTIFSPESHKSITGDTDINDGDFLGRIQKLLSEPMIFPADSIDMDQSHATDSILEGDRPWEHTPTLKPRTVADEFNSTKGDITSVSAKVMGENTTKEPVINSVPHTGGLEALKQMLFTMQSLTDVGTADESNPQNSDDAGVDDLTAHSLAQENINPADASALLSPQTKLLLTDTETPGGDSMKRAMEHLAKLKQLAASDDIHIS